MLSEEEGEENEDNFNNEVIEFDEEENCINN